MSAVEEDLEEGEISDSDSMGEEEKVLPKAEKPPQQYSIFGNQPNVTNITSKQKSIPRPPKSDSDNSDDDSASSDSDYDGNKKQKFHKSHTDPTQSSTFVNPNFVNNGGKMPPMPKQSSRAIWGSILQEQILTSEVGNFSMEAKLPSDRDVESYDYSRAKEDDRPFPVEDEMKSGEEDLFGEVIDLEKSTTKQRRNLKRKHVSDRLGKRHSVKDRLDLPKVTESSSVEEITFYISKKLQESKMHLIRRVVQFAGGAKALNLLQKTEEMEAAGGMLIMNGSRRRTPGGVYLTLLKTESDVSKEQLDEIFEEENKWAMEVKKRKKAIARRRKRDRDSEKAKMTSATDDKGNKPGSMEVTEEHSRSSVEGQTGSPKNHDDHLSDTQDNDGTKFEDSSSSEDEKSEEEDFEKQLAREVQRQAAAKQAPVDHDSNAVTLDDVLDLGIDEEDIE